MTSPPLPDEALAPLALALLRGVGPVAWRRLIVDHPDPATALAHAVAPGDVEAAIGLARRAECSCRERGITVLTPVDERYPPALLDLEDAPAPLYAAGDFSLAHRPAVALVGARRATSYGRRVAHRFAATLAARGVCVVSGLAAGIDAEAHAGALEGAGKTIAVLGTGVDVAYPVANTTLHRLIREQGLLLSESPPGRAAHPGAFPRRNRLIAALADVVVVVEAGERSGALITAQIGASLARPVAAVPGPIDCATARGSNALLRDGLHAVTTAEDVLALLALTTRGRTAPQTADHAASLRIEDQRTAAEPRPASAERRILEILDAGPQFADELAHAAAVSPREVGVALSVLDLSGLVATDPSGLVRRL